MEWVVTTGKTVDEAKDQALDQLGVAADEAEFEVVEEPRTGLFGRVKAEARVRARVRPAQVRPKHDRRERGKGKSNRKGKSKGGSNQGGGQPADDASATAVAEGPIEGADGTSRSDGNARSTDSSTSNGKGKTGAGRQRSKRQRQQKEHASMNGETPTQSDVTPEQVGEAAVTFMEGLTTAFGAEATATLAVDGTDLEVKVAGDELGLLVGPGGRTLTAVQDLARVASQRRLGDHETRLRIDVAGYREKRKEALEHFAVAVAHQVAEQGQPKALEPMSSADRKAVHDAITGIDSVTSRSEGDEPNRRVVITPAG